MRALWLTSSYPRYAGDHAGIFLHRWARGLVARGAEVRVLAPAHDGSPAREVMDGVEVVRFPYFWPRRMQKLAYGDAGLMVGIGASALAKAQVAPFAASLFANTVRESRDADLVHAFWTPMGAVALASRLLRRRPVVLSPLGTDLRALPRAFNRAVIGGAQAIIAGGGPSTEVHDTLAGLTRKPLQPIYLPLDEEGLDGGDADAFRREIDLKDERLVAFIARMYDLKDPWTMFEAAKLLVERRPDARVVFVGDGPLLRYLREAAKSHQLEEQAIFTGARTDVGSILKASEVFVSLNLVDNCWATTIAEAMHLGVPCVVSEGGERERTLFPHLDAAYLVPQRDPLALAVAIDRILGDPSLATRLAEGGRNLLETHRRRDSLIFDDTLKLYESVTNA